MHWGFLATAELDEFCRRKCLDCRIRRFNGKRNLIILEVNFGESWPAHAFSVRRKKAEAARPENS